MLFGAHVSAAGGISKAIDRIEEIGGKAVQVFTQSPRMWRPTAHTRRGARALPQRAASRRAFATSPATRSTSSTSRAATARSARSRSTRSPRRWRRRDAIGADAVVFHVGSHLGYGFDDALDVVAPAPGAARAHDRRAVALHGERRRRRRNHRAVGRRARGALSTRLDGHRRLGICLDSCHWWASGVDVTDAAVLEEALEDLDERIGLERVRVLHVNDANTPLGSNRDRHDVVAGGRHRPGARDLPRSSGVP